MSLNSKCPLFLASIKSLDYLRLNSAGNNIEGVANALQEFNMTPNIENAGYSGIIIEGTLGETVAVGETLYLKSDGKYWKSNAGASTTMPCTTIATEAGAANQIITLLSTGFIRNDAWTWTVGGILYPSKTSGAITQDLSAYTTGDQVQSIGTAYGTNIIHFNPSPVLVEIDENLALLPEGGTVNQYLAKSSSADYDVAWTTPAPAVIQVVNLQDGSYKTGNTAIPFDNTIPQKTEGDLYMTLKITPTSALSTLYIDVVFAGSIGTENNLVIALFMETAGGGAVANAIAAAFDHNFPGGNTVAFKHKMTAGVTEEITFTVRAGTGDGNYVHFNGNGNTSARLFGGVCASSITITEVKA